ncbi:MAG: hypothetical protein C7B46_00120 [Sulfobacillus benefaciens]|uniref:Uncharacterized protein n=1 Tax=Sulfobacillus benefaciens TaxID=453960 RepID=A0A2T2XLR3_9FIRM|nr:MAG: hypothetical protein C7B46_00120 [Sulfobacillus benefaciens]
MNKIEEIVKDPSLTVAERIRRLHVLGLSRTEIAQHLDKRYQHVRNTLVGPGAADAIAATKARMMNDAKAPDGASDGSPLSGTPINAPSGSQPDWAQELLAEVRQIRDLLQQIRDDQRAM